MKVKKLSKDELNVRLNWLQQNIKDRQETIEYYKTKINICNNILKESKCQLKRLKKERQQR